MELSEKLSALILASEVIKNVGIHADHETRQKVSNELMERLSGALSEMDGTPAAAAPATPDTAGVVEEKPKRGRKSEQSKKPAATQTDDSVEEKAVTEQAVKAAEEPTPEPVVEEPTPEPVVEEPTPEPVVEEPTPEPVVEEPTPEPAVEEPTPEPAVEEPTPEPVVALDYDKDVAPAVRAAAAADRGRAVDLLKAYGASRATEVKEEDWPVFIRQMRDIAHGK